ncbi:MAG TPA: large conductance mechanosensitive channel protein MscL [Allosphingosinicella sp.]|nr:large conductance mechanosensitive channel protein MscL [Allosphingosinicella sp.]
MGEFRAFIARGNVLDLAVAVIIGAAFTAIVTSLTGDVIMPLIGAVVGKLDFSNYYVLLGPIPDSYHGATSYAALKAAGVPMLGYGAFLTALVNFLILAFIVFLLVKAATRALRRKEPAAEAPAGPTEEVLLLREIRDALKARP